MRLLHLLIDFAIRYFSPSVCIFNLTSTSGKISVIICLQVSNFFPFLENLNYYHLPGKYLFHFQGVCFHSWEISIVTFYQALYRFPPGELIFTSGEISIITFYQINTLFPLQGNSFPLLGKSQLLPSTR